MVFHVLHRNKKFAPTELKLNFPSELSSYFKTSLQAKGTKSTLFLTHVCVMHVCVRNEVDLVTLACNDDFKIKF